MYVKIIIINIRLQREGYTVGNERKKQRRHE